jgi:hypothetical protein
MIAGQNGVGDGRGVNAEWATEPVGAGYERCKLRLRDREWIISIRLFAQFASIKFDIQRLPPSGVGMPIDDRGAWLGRPSSGVAHDSAALAAE